MNSVVVGTIVLAGTLGGAFAGIRLRGRLPERHLGTDSQDVVKLATGLIGTMSALVLGLLIASAKNSFDTQGNGFQTISIDVIVLDRSLKQYGPEAAPARRALRQAVTAAIDTLWPSNGARSADLDSPLISQAGALLMQELRELPADTETQRAVRAEALQTATNLGRTRWLLHQQEKSALPVPFLVVLIFWLNMLFFCFGLLSPRNTTVMAVLLICAICVATAVFLIVDLDQPFEGIIQISDSQMQRALQLLQE